MTPRFRVGRHHKDRTLYDGDTLIGCVDPGYGPMIVDALNRAKAPQPRVLWRGPIGQIAASLLGKKPSARGWDPDMRVRVIEDTETPEATDRG